MRNTVFHDPMSAPVNLDYRAERDVSRVFVAVVSWTEDFRRRELARIKIHDISRGWRNGKG